MEINLITGKDKELLVQSVEHMKLKHTKEKYWKLDCNYKILLSTVSHQYSISLQADDKILVINVDKNTNFIVEHSNIFDIVRKVISEAE